MLNMMRDFLELRGGGKLNLVFSTLNSNSIYVLNDAINYERTVAANAGDIAIKIGRGNVSTSSNASMSTGETKIWYN